MTSAPKTMSTDALASFWANMSGYIREKLDGEFAAHLDAEGVLDHYKNLAPVASDTLDKAKICAQHGFWLLWLDDARNEFVFPEGLVDPEKPIVFGSNGAPGKDDQLWAMYQNRVLKRGYNLASGGGSLGLGVRLDAGVCLRDTIRDTRGAVAFEDFLSRNYSFIGVPIYHAGGDVEVVPLGSRGKPFVIFCLLYPKRGAWHDDKASCCRGKEADGNGGRCLYRKIAKFCSDTVRPVTELAFELLQLRAWQDKSNDIAKLGNTGADDVRFRKEVLRTFVRSAKNDDIKKDLLGFRTAALHLLGGTAADPSITSVKEDNLDELTRSHLRATYSESSINKDVFNESVKQLLGVSSLITKTFPLSLKDRVFDLTLTWPEDRGQPGDVASLLRPLLDRCAALMVKSAWLGVSGQGSIDTAIDEIKWEELVLDKTCQAIADTLVTGRLIDTDLRVLEENKNTSQSSASVTQSIQCPVKAVCAFMTMPEEWKISDIKVAGTECTRAIYELESFPHTRRTIYRLLTALYRSKLLPFGGSKLTVKTAPGNPLKSETTPPKDTAMLDCGSRTAVNDIRIWNAWKVENDPKSVEDIVITSEHDSTWVITIGRLKILVSRNASEVKGQLRELGFALSPEGEEGNALPENPTAAGEGDVNAIIKAFLGKKCGTGADNKEHCVPCISQIAGAWHVKRTRSACNGECIFERQNELRTNLISLVEQCHHNAMLVGVNSYLISPLWITRSSVDKDEVRGILVLGSPQREYDTPDRIWYSDQQLFAVQFAGDYLELAISRKIEADHAADERARAEAVAHLEGIEPHVRSLINDVNRMKLTAERVARRISPAQHGVFAFDSETVKLFHEGALTIDFDIQANQSDRDDIWRKFMKETRNGSTPPIKTQDRVTAVLNHSVTAVLNKSMPIVEWHPDLNLKIREGSWDQGTSWSFKGVHNIDSGGNVLDSIWLDYRKLLYLLGLARNNSLMREFSLYVPEKGQSARLFNAAKLLFHRLHFPGDSKTKHVFTVQLLAALAGAGRKVSVSFNGTHCSFEGYRELLSLIAKTDDIVLPTKTEESPRWCIAGNANEFVPEFDRFCQEFCSPDRAVKLNSIAVIVDPPDVNVGSRKCVIELKCTGVFDDSMLHRSEAANSGMDGASEHGLTKAVLMLEKCLRAYLKKDSTDTFAFKVKENPKQTTFTLRLTDLPNAP